MAFLQVHYPRRHAVANSCTHVANSRCHSTAKDWHVNHLPFKRVLDQSLQQGRYLPSGGHQGVWTGIRIHRLDSPWLMIAKPLPLGTAHAARCVFRRHSLLTAEAMHLHYRHAIALFGALIWQQRHRLLNLLCSLTAAYIYCPTRTAGSTTSMLIVNGQTIYVT